MLIGILSVAGEYRHKTIVETFVTTPKRHQVITAKLAVAVATALLFAVIGAASSACRGSDLAQLQRWSGP
jgi:ABC-2 type transport system permease protein